MKQTELTQAIEKVVEFKLRAVDIVIKEIVEPLEKVGSPEDLIKKPYETWTPEDLSMLIKVYGMGENTPLSNLIFRKAYKNLKELEGGLNA